MHKVFENEHCIAFLDINPSAEGHTLLIPKAHYSSLDKMPEDAVAQTLRVLPKISRMVTKAVGTDDFNIVQNNGSIAGQVVFHVHFHIIPRKPNDGLRHHWPNQRLHPEKAKEILSKIVQE